MNCPRTSAHSPYMEFAKLRSDARFNLAASGVMNYPLAGLPVELDDLEINGPTVYGYAPLQERLARKNGVDPDCVVAATGTSLANHLAMAGTFEPGDEVLVEEPTYELLLSAAQYLGAEIRRFPRPYEDGFRIHPQDVARNLTSRTKLIVITNLHNPTSVLVDSETMAAVGELARSVGARVLVDEVYIEALFDQPERSAFHLGNHFVVTSSLTKAYGLSGLRCGWILAEPDLARRIWRINDLYGATPAHIPERISVIALDNIETVAACAKALLETNRKNLFAMLDAHPALPCVRPPSGTTVFPKLPHGTVEDFCALLRNKYETSVVPGHFFEMQQHFRVGIGGDTAMTAEALVRLGKALDEFGVH